MKYRTYQTEAVKDTPHQVDVRQLYDDASAQVMHIILKPGESLKPHKTPVDVVFYILEGSPTVHVGTHSQVFTRDFLIESPADIVHHLSNESDSIARILVTKAPRPVKKTKLL